VEVDPLRHTGGGEVAVSDVNYGQKLRCTCNRPLQTSLLAGVYNPDVRPAPPAKFMGIRPGSIFWSILEYRTSNS
jgi:hypothetical protein